MYASTKSKNTTHYVLDVRSDTVSLPTPEMRKAMFECEVGDDVYGEDPTILKLEQTFANIFEKDAGLFVPSGTMGNLLAIMVHCHRRGTEAIVGDLSHTFLYEQGGAAHIAGVQLATIKNQPDGTFSLDELRHKVRYVDYHEPITSLIVVENTQNICGGKVLPLEWLDKLGAMLCDPTFSPTRVALHMDGARVFNAAAALQVPVARITKHCDSVSICLSKGLSAPVGSVLVGNKKFIDEARRLRKALGGGMRQAGILAAAGLVAIETIVPRLSEDHKKAKRIAEGIEAMHSPNITADATTTQSNIMFIELLNHKISSAELTKRLLQVTAGEIAAGLVVDGGERGIVLKVSSRDWKFARIVLYHHITEADVDLIIKKFQFVIKEFDEKLKA